MLGWVLAAAVAGQVAPVALHFDCAGPVAARQPATALLVAFGKAARRETLPGPGGRMAKAIVLYPDDPARRMEITFWDDAQTAVESVTIGARATAWTGPLGLHIGSSLADVVVTNGRNFGISGFGWRYGGYITSSWGGKLAPSGGCATQVRFALPAAPKATGRIIGELDLDSTMPAVKGAGARIDQLSIGWPLPAGVKAASGGDERLGY